MSKKTYKKTLASSTISILLLPLLLSSLMLFSIFIIPTTAPPAGTPWPMFLYDPAHTGYTTDNGPETAQITWAYKTKGSSYCSPVVVDDVAYIPSLDGYLYAVNDTTGLHLWNASVGVVIASSPAVADGVIYVASNTNWTITSGPKYDGKTDPPYNITAGIIIAINKDTGKQLWNRTLEPPKGVNPYRSNSTLMWSSPAVVNGVLYVGSNDNNTYAIDVTTHDTLWNYTTEGWVQSSPAVLNDAVYVSSQVTCNVTSKFKVTGTYSPDSYLYAIGATNGSLIWRWQPNGTGINETNTENAAFNLTQRCIWTPAVAETTNGPMVYVDAFDGHGFYALNATSEPLSDEERIVWMGPGVDKFCINFFGEPTVSNGVVYNAFAVSFTPWGGGLYAWNATTGDLISDNWPIYPWPANIMCVNSPIIAGGNKMLYLFVGLASPSFLYAIDISTLTSPKVLSTNRWPFWFPNGAFLPPAIYNGAVYVGCLDGYLYKIGPPPPGPNLAIAPEDIFVYPKAVKVGTPVSINVTVWNVGTEATSSAKLKIRIYYDDILIQEKLTSTLVLAPGAYTNVTFTWSTSRIFEGEHTISAEVVPFTGEGITVDNICYDGKVLVFWPISVNITHDWPMFLHDSNRTGFTQAYGPIQPRVNWASDIQAVECAAVVNGTVYVVGDSNLFALNASTGDLIWNYTIGQVGDSSPVVVGDVIYVATNPPQPLALPYITWIPSYAHWTTEKDRDGNWSILLNTGSYYEMAGMCGAGLVVITSEVLGNPINFSDIADSDLTYYGYFNSSKEVSSNEAAYYPYFNLTIEYLNGTQVNTTSIASVGSWTVAGSPTSQSWIQMKASGGWYGDLFPGSNITNPKTRANVDSILNATNKANITDVIITYGGWDNVSLSGGASGYKAEDWTVYIDDIAVKTRSIIIEPSEKMLALYTNGTLKWKKLKTPYGVSGSPAVVDGAIYVATGGDNINGILYALDKDTGNKIWNFTLYGALVMGTSPIVYDGVVYIASTMVNWTAFGGDIWSALGSPWLIGGRLYAVNNNTGAEIWNFNMTGDPISPFNWKAALASPAVAKTANGTIVYFGVFDTYGFYFLNATSQPLSNEQRILWIGGSAYLTWGGGPIVYNGTVYKGCGGIVRTLNATTAEPGWVFITNENTGDSSPAIDGNGVLYIGDEKGWLYAVNITSGDEIWRFYPPNTVEESNVWSPAVVDDMIYVVTETGRVFAIGGRDLMMNITGTALQLPWGATEVFPIWTINITVTLTNTGTQSETVQVRTYYGYSPGKPMAGTANIVTIPQGTYNTNITWICTEPSTYNYTIPLNGYIPYNITAEATLVPAVVNGTLIIRKPADADADGHCTGGDLGMVGRAWYKSYPSARYNWRVDFDGDGIITGGDLNILGKNWYKY